MTTTVSMKLNLLNGVFTQHSASIIREREAAKSYARAFTLDFYGKRFE